MNEPLPPDEVWPCGCSVHCTIFRDTNTVTILPCSMTCPQYLGLIAKATSLGIPQETYDLTDGPG